MKPIACRSGVCEGTGQDFVVTLGCFPDVDSDKRAGTFMHELGHSLGLDHGGADGIIGKPNYYSVMNYAWQWPAAALGRGRDMQRYRESWRLDYSRSRLNELNEALLDERAGIGGDATRVVPVGPPRGTFRPWVMLVPMGGPVDWSDPPDGRADEDHQVYWRHRDESGRTVSSGVYFVELRSGTYRVQRMVVLLN